MDDAECTVLAVEAAFARIEVDIAPAGGPSGAYLIVNVDMTLSVGGSVETKLQLVAPCAHTERAPSARGGSCGPIVVRTGQGTGLLALFQGDDDPEDKVGNQARQATRKEQDEEE